MALETPSGGGLLLPLPDPPDSKSLLSSRQRNRPQNIRSSSSNLSVSLEDNFVLEDLKTPVKSLTKTNKKSPKKKQNPTKLPKVGGSEAEEAKMKYNPQSPKKSTPAVATRRNKKRLPLIKTSKVPSIEEVEQPLRYGTELTVT